MFTRDISQEDSRAKIDFSASETRRKSLQQDLHLSERHRQFLKSGMVQHKTEFLLLKVSMTVLYQRIYLKTKYFIRET